ncbi:hypothetical protein DdX_21823 [Ditylenchus destructor]|uniref:Uncharacterized protein n=1 Tax=Ditylenchus destructor TaxID=166010 RepID=A0AAD4MIF5_9BILA|nr:hypothetical protein DdX_21823 [Ditylenchus destructor]
MSKKFKVSKPTSEILRYKANFETGNCHKSFKFYLLSTGVILASYIITFIMAQNATCPAGTRITALQCVNNTCAPGYICATNTCCIVASGCLRTTVAQVQLARRRARTFLQRLNQRIAQRQAQLQAQLESNNITAK